MIKADAGDLIGPGAGAFKGFANGPEQRLPDLFRIMLDPAGMRIGAADMPVSPSEQAEAPPLQRQYGDARGSLINAKVHVAHMFPSRAPCSALPGRSSDHYTDQSAEYATAFCNPPEPLPLSRS